MKRNLYVNIQKHKTQRRYKIRLQAKCNEIAQQNEEKQTGKQRNKNEIKENK